jgi:hypothetical protein
VIAATRWQLPADLSVDAIDSLIASALTRNAPLKQDDRLWIADSKAIYRPPGGLAPLERHLLPLLTAANIPMQSFATLWEHVDPASFASRHDEPWFAPELPLPLAWPVSADELASRGATVQNRLAETGVTLETVRARLVSPARFNAILEVVGSKGVLLSETTLCLVASLWELEAHRPAFVYCDKHGGRNRYADLLQHVAGEQMVQTLAEGAESSRYRVGKTEVRFGVRSERYLPVAAASMVAKYLRELAMHQFNVWWQAQVPGLAPTAGYPVDAKRFWQAIAAARRTLALPEALLWRTK